MCSPGGQAEKAYQLAVRIEARQIAEFGHDGQPLIVNTPADSAEPRSRGRCDHAKLGSVVSNVMGTTGECIPEAMIGEEDDPTVLAGPAKGRLRGKRRELGEVVPGLVRDHHRFLLRRHLDMIDELST